MKPRMEAALARTALLVLAPLALLAPACAGLGTGLTGEGEPDGYGHWDKQRREMVATQIATRGLQDPALLEAMEGVPRHRFVPEARRELAYADRSLEVEPGLSMLRPYTLAALVSELRPDTTARVLLLGPGLGYEAAVLGRLCGELWALDESVDRGRRTHWLLKDLGAANVEAVSGELQRGWPGRAPYQRILVLQESLEPSGVLLEQLAPQGLMIVFRGEAAQAFDLFVREPGGRIRRERHALPSAGVLP